VPKCVQDTLDKADQAYIVLDIGDKAVSRLVLDILQVSIIVVAIVDSDQGEQELDSSPEKDAKDDHRDENAD